MVTLVRCENSKQVHIFTALIMHYSMVAMWLACDDHMGCPWISCKVYVMITWDLHGYHVMCNTFNDHIRSSWVSCELHVMITWDLHGYHVKCM